MREALISSMIICYAIKELRFFIKKGKKKRENESSHKIELGTKHLECPPQGQTWKEKQITWDG